MGFASHLFDFGRWRWHHLLEMFASAFYGLRLPFAFAAGVGLFLGIICFASAVPLGRTRLHLASPSLVGAPSFGGWAQSCPQYAYGCLHIPEISQLSMLQLVLSCTCFISETSNDGGLNSVHHLPRRQTRGM